MGWAKTNSVAKMCEQMNTSAIFLPDVSTVLYNTTTTYAMYVLIELNICEKTRKYRRQHHANYNNNTSTTTTSTHTTWSVSWRQVFDQVLRWVKLDHRGVAATKINAKFHRAVHMRWARHSPQMDGTEIGADEYVMRDDTSCQHGLGRDVLPLFSAQYNKS